MWLTIDLYRKRQTVGMNGTFLPLQKTKMPGVCPGSGRSVTSQSTENDDTANGTCQTKVDQTQDKSIDSSIF